MQVDLHCHSNFSDGLLSPRELVQQAKKNGVQLLALTDHDNIKGLTEAKIACQENSVKFVTGVEISVSWNNRVIHVVGLNFNPQHQALVKLIDSIRMVRLNRLVLIAEKLEKLGINGVYDGALALSRYPDTVGRLHIAEYLLNQGVVSSIQQAFNKYLGEGKKGYVRMQWGSLEEVVQLIVEAGGIAVLAHPLRYNLTLSKIREFLDDFVYYGGKGIEVGCSSHSDNEMITTSLLAAQYNLFASSGSDFHGNEYNHQKKLGVTPDLPVGCRPIWKNFEI